ncbi:MAG: OmpA family protein [Candidatus Aminicenantales bacterium]
MNAISRAALLALALAPGVIAAQPQETEIPNVTAELAELRTSGGVTRLAIRYKNPSAKQAGSNRFAADQITLVDVKSKKKHSPIKDARGRFIAGPFGDEIGGGRIYVLLEPGQEGLAWAYFDAIPAGTVVSVEVPQMFPFEDVTVTEGPGQLTFATKARSTPYGALATLGAAAKRADEAVSVRIKLETEPGMKVDLVDSYFRYNNVYLFDPAGKRVYPLLKDAEGRPQASPALPDMPNAFLYDWRKTTLMSLTFQAPPDDVTTVDLVMNEFLPIEGLVLEGSGGAGAGGVAAAGKTLGLEGALKELNAQVTPEEIKVDLSADMLFDLDKADLKPAALAQLNHLLTVVNSRPNAKVAIEGHTDLRGEVAYNSALSQRRADSVRRWLAEQGIAAIRLTATGAGESRPVRTGNTEAAHQANRRVEIRIKGS